MVSSGITGSIFQVLVMILKLMITIIFQLYKLFIINILITDLHTTIGITWY